ncbi:MAG: zinc-binding alcohol dehydrogenase family protein [Pedobacter sp.]|nr:MAG: zinc-binding alcohol dehydrogenase family protein [Pedobacter sp.]
MQTLTCSNPGVFTYEERDKPILIEGYTILKINRLGLCGTDYHAFRGTQPYFNYPRILGHEIAAVVSETSTSSGYSVGELVTVIPYYHCGTCIACRKGKTNCCVDMKVCGVHIDGAMQEYFLVKDEAIIKGRGLTADELALVEPLAIGAHGIARAGIAKDEYVLVIGAGPIGLTTMNFANIAAAKVIAVDVNEARLSFCVEQLGVAHVINAAHENVVERLREITGGDMPTVMIDCTGNLEVINSAVAYMAHGARLVLIGLQKEAIVINHPEFHKREGTLMSSRNAFVGDFEFVIDCIEKGLVKPLDFITHRIKFSAVGDRFEELMDPKNGVIKALIEF